MRLLKPAVLLLLAVLLGVAAWVTYRVRWFPPSPSPRPSAEYAGHRLWSFVKCDPALAVRPAAC